MKKFKALSDNDLEEDTVVALAGDHGWSLDEHGEWSKFGLFVQATRVPLIIRDPGAR